MRSCVLLGRRVKDDYLPDWTPGNRHIQTMRMYLEEQILLRDPCGRVQTVAAGSAVQMASLLR